MTPPRTRCLLLACGNTLRSDDGIGPWLAAWAEQHFESDSRIRVLSRQQWTPELAEDLAQADTVLFLDSSVDATPGDILVRKIHPAGAGTPVGTHHLDGSELLALAAELYSGQPREARLLTVGAGSFGLGDRFSPEVTRCLPQACEQLKHTLLELLSPAPEN